VARELRKHGFDDVHPLLGGFDEWVKRGGPVEPK
jgi:rhodanese-related sulfurtransferase